MRRRFVLAAVFSLFTLAISTAAQNKTKFSGTWELDHERSKLGDHPTIDTQTLTVTQTDKELTVEKKTRRTSHAADESFGDERWSGHWGGFWGGDLGGDFDSDFGDFGRDYDREIGRDYGRDTNVTYDLSGKETRSEMEGRWRTVPVRHRAKVDGAKLLLTSSSRYEGFDGDNTITAKQKWTLSSDGKTLTIKVEFSGIRGRESSTRVYSKKS